MGWSIVGVSHTICFDAWCKPACTLQKQCKTKNALQGLLRWPSGLSRVSSSITGRITSVLPPRMERNDTFTTFGQWQITCVIKKNNASKQETVFGRMKTICIIVCASAYDELPVHSSLRSISMHLLLSFLFQPSCHPYWSKSQQVANGKGLSTCRFRCSPLPQTTATSVGLFSWWSWCLQIKP